MTDQEKIDKFNNVLKTITDSLEEKMPPNKFSFEEEIRNWEPRYILIKNGVKQEVFLHYNFIIDVVLGVYPASELVAACKYELERTDK